MQTAAGLICQTASACQENCSTASAFYRIRTMAKKNPAAVSLGRLGGKKSAQGRMEKMSPERRLIEPEEVAAMAVYLSLDISKGITGQAINIDGGGIMS